MAIAAYDVSPGVHVYAKYATGYRAGGASSRTADYKAFNPEDIKSYEVGLKSDFWNHRARFNLAAYIMDRKNSQVDLSTIQPVEGLTLNASYAYTYTDIPLSPITYTEYAATIVAPNTVPLPTGRTTTVLQKFYVVFTPRNAASASLDYRMPLGNAGTAVKLHLDANYSQSTQSFDQFDTHNDASLLFNGRLALADIGMAGTAQKLTVSAWVRNMFDTQYVYRRDPSNSLPSVQATNVLVGSIGNVLGDYGNFNAPRTFGVDATVTF